MTDEALSDLLVRLAKLIEPEVPAEITFSLLLYEKREDPHNGRVSHIARDRDLALAAVAKWVYERLEARSANEADA